MSTQPKKPSKDDVLAAYQAVNQHWAHAEQERWSLLYNFLTANTILLLAWATIFSSQLLAKTLALFTLSLSGLIISILWLTIGSRVNTFIKQYGKLGETVEGQLNLHTIGPFHIGEIIRVEERSKHDKLNLEERLGSIISSHKFVLLVPLLFAVIYVVLFLLSWPTPSASTSA